MIDKKLQLFDSCTLHIWSTFQNPAGINWQSVQLKCKKSSSFHHGNTMHIENNQIDCNKKCTFTDISTINNVNFYNRKNNLWISKRKNIQPVICTIVTCHLVSLRSCHGKWYLVMASRPLNHSMTHFKVNHPGLLWWLVFINYTQCDNYTKLLLLMSLGIGLFHNKSDSHALKLSHCKIENWSPESLMHKLTSPR